MQSAGMHPFLILWIVVGGIQALMLLAFPSAFRAIYIGWNGAWGLKIDPKSPILSNIALRFFGVLTLALVIFVVVMVTQADSERLQEEQRQQEQFDNFWNDSISD